MKVEARQGGGIAGHALNQVAGPVDTAEAGDAGSSIEALAEEVGFLDLPDEFPDVRDIADAMWHSLEAEEGDRKHKVTWSDRAEPPDELAEMTRLVVDAAGGWRDAD